MNTAGSPHVPVTADNFVRAEPTDISVPWQGETWAVVHRREVASIERQTSSAHRDTLYSSRVRPDADRDDHNADAARAICHCNDQPGPFVPAFLRRGRSHPEGNVGTRYVAASMRIWSTRQTRKTSVKSTACRTPSSQHKPARSKCPTDQQAERSCDALLVLAVDPAGFPQGFGTNAGRSGGRSLVQRRQWGGNPDKDPPISTSRRQERRKYTIA